MRGRRRATVLTGSFSDEIFGGYPWFHDPEVLATDAFPWQGSAPRVWTSLSPDYIERVNPAGVERERYHALLEKVPSWRPSPMTVTGVPVLLFMAASSTLIPM
ncbi:asparagine synthase-related protein [Nonomuraea jabiensis]|uniref:Asparagine synthetase B (Glutamine-hydrolyzing) n=1 Tax=Nonomuraea jabiensis TaxID=882448 RepID=A0A7W9L8W6_9ACTN|nr:asparagine synthase-related protein [Nonomuraea jabiensis]MBB5774926.1 asparagine synthetase B (glutamine-hydrolyzing) [Nonomuraea jabiensis]